MGYQFTNGIADKLLRFCLPLYVYDLTQSGSQMAFVFGMGVAPHLLFNMFGGALIDYFDRRKILIVTSLLSGVTLLGFSILIFHLDNGANLELICILNFLLATCNSIDLPAFESSALEYFEKEDLVPINTTIETLVYISCIVAPLLGATIRETLGSKFAILIISIFYLFSSLLVIFSKVRRDHSIKKKFNELGELLYEHFQLTKQGFAYIFRPECPIQLGILMSVFSNLFLGFKETLFLYLVKANFHLEDMQIASSLAAVALIALLLLCLEIKVLNRYHPFSVMIVALIADALAIMFIGLSPHILILFSFYCLSIVTETTYNIFWKTFRQSYIPINMMGRVIGICRGLAYGAISFGALIVGALIESNYVSIQFIFIIGGIIVAIFGMLIFYFKKFYHPSAFKNKA